MIKRTYFVAYAGQNGVIGSVTFSSRSFFPIPQKVFMDAVKFLSENHPGCVITDFKRV